MKKPVTSERVKNSKKYYDDLRNGRIKNRKSVSYKRIIAPVCFRLTDRGDRKHLLKMLRSIGRYVSAGERVLIDFSRTKKMISDGTLIFYAEILRLLNLYPSAYGRIRSNLPHDDTVRQVLCQIGLMKILHSNNWTTPKGEDVVNWRAAHGQITEGEKYDSIMEAYNGRITDELQDQLYNGITEAMTNCTQHAYIMPRGDGVKSKELVRGWWMFSQVKDDNLMVVFCDLGVGIPKTLPHTKPGYWQKFMSSLSGADIVIRDSRVIKEAVEYGRTRTDLENRGKGLPQMADLVTGFDGAEFVVLSNCGSYSIKGGSELFFDYDDSIMGTLVFWKVPVSKVSK